jgi:twitching motility protein PilT
MTKQQIKIFEREKELDFGMQYNINNRFRVNIHQQKGYVEATFRSINTKISSFEELKIPERVKDLARQKSGLVLITGPTSSGKTTTIAAMVELINQERKAVIITLERPIEYIHSNIKSIIKQREIGVDTCSFSVALKSSLRQDPNIIVVGELEDMETINTALIAAEAGYLVIASFHSQNTIQAIDRLVGIFPIDNRRQILTQLAYCLKGIVTQLLVPHRDKRGRILATEILIVNDAVRKIIRNDEIIQLPTVIQTGAGYKMHSMEESLSAYYEQGLIDGETFEWYSKEFKFKGHLRT